MKFWAQKVCIILVAVAAVSCSGYSKVLKGEDRDLKYHKALEYFDAGKYHRTIALLEDITSFYANTYRDDTIAYYLGSAYYKQGDFSVSGEHFRNFRSRFGRSPFLEDAEYMYAKGYYFASPAPQRDQTMTHQAIVAINEYLNRYPNSVKRESLIENLDELQGRLYEKSFLNARLYYNIGYYKSAVVALRNALDEAPETPRREDLSYLIVAANYQYARNSVHEMQRERYMNMQDAYYTFTAEFPESKYRKEVDKMQEEAKTVLAKFNNSDTEDGSKKE